MRLEMPDFACGRAGRALPHGRRTATAPSADLTFIAAERAPAATTVVRDLHSFARPEEARVTHVALDLTADFAAQALAGTATLTLARPARRRRSCSTPGPDNPGHRRRPAHALSYALGARRPDPRPAADGHAAAATITKVVVDYRTRRTPPRCNG